MCLVGITHIGGYETRFAVIAPRRAIGFVPSGHHDVGTGVEEAVSDASADALRAAGDDDHTACEIEGIGPRIGHRKLLENSHG